MTVQIEESLLKAILAQHVALVKAVEALTAALNAKVEKEKKK